MSDKRDGLMNSLFTLCEEAILSLSAVGAGTKRADVVINAERMRRQLARLRGVAKEIGDGQKEPD